MRISLVFSRPLRQLSVLMALSFIAFQSSAQIPGGDKGPGTLNAAMVHLFGPNTNFIAKTEAHVYDKNKKETTVMPLGFEMLSGNIRVEVNLTQVRSVEISPELFDQMKQIGMDRLVTVQMLDKKTVLTIYPGLKSYVEMPMGKDEIEAVNKDYKIQRTRNGKETIDGHVCDKDNVSLLDDKGVQQKAIVWFAKDLKDFPVQIQLTEGEATLVMHFKEIKLGRPEASHFEKPTGMKKFDTMEQLTTDAAMRKVNSAFTK